MLVDVVLARSDAGVLTAGATSRSSPSATFGAAGSPFLGSSGSWNPSNVPKDPWGNITAETGPALGGVEYAFTGREWDRETGLYYYRARYYDPKAGRFISEDPIGLAGGINMYAYVNGNPVNRVDPSGLVDQRQAAAEVGELLAKWALEKEGYTVVLSGARKAVTAGGADLVAVRGSETLMVDNKAYTARRTVSEASALTANLQKNVATAIGELDALLKGGQLGAAESAAARAAMAALQHGTFTRVVTGCGGVASRVGRTLGRAGVAFKVLGMAGPVMFVGSELLFVEDIGGFLSDVPLTDAQLDAYNAYYR